MKKSIEYCIDGAVVASMMFGLAACGGPTEEQSEAGRIDDTV